MTKPQSKPQPPPPPPPPLAYLFFELIAQATAVGKSIMAKFLTDMLRQMGHRVILVRIESKVIKQAGADVAIDAEDFAQAARLPGGVAGVLRNLFLTLEQAAREGTIVIVDWGGGLADYRAEAYAATRFDERLEELGIRGLCFVVTTCATDRMNQASESLATCELIAPKLERGLILNKRIGPFSFVAGSDEHKVWEKLQRTAKGSKMVEIPAVAGESWKKCSDAGLTMSDVIESDLGQLTAQLNDPRILAAAYQSHVAAWWIAAEKAMLPLLLNTHNAAKP